MCMLYILNLVFCIIGSSFAYEKYCVNCKYFVRNPFSKDTFGKCSAFRKNIDYNKIDYLVSGKEKIEYKFCVSAREDEELCGKEGNMYIERSNLIKDFIIPLLTTKPKCKNNINI